MHAQKNTHDYIKQIIKDKKFELQEVRQQFSR